MPLNKDNRIFYNVEEESKQQRPPQPIQKHHFGVKYFFVGFFIIAVVSSVVFLVYIFLMKQQEVFQPPQEITESPLYDTTTIAAIELPDTSIKTIPEIISEKVPEIISSGFYTIYIAAYPVQPPASDEVGRWNDANYDASVVESNKYFSVALGHYQTVAEARKFAEEMFDAFENGYFIGKIK